MPDQNLCSSCGGDGERRAIDGGRRLHSQCKECERKACNKKRAAKRANAQIGQGKDPAKDCGASARYKGFREPTCNDGAGCDACRTIYEAAQAMEKARQARRMGSDYAALKAEDFDVSVGNVGRADGKAAAEKRQEFNALMGEFSEAVRTSGGDPLQIPAKLGSYIGGLAQQELRFSNRRLARSVSIVAAHAEIGRQLFKETAQQFFSDRITPTGYALKAPPTKPLKRKVMALLSDLHFGANLDARSNPLPYREIEEARRFEYFVRQTLDYKPQYREDTELVVMINGDVIDGFLGHDPRAGIALSEQKAVFWHHFRHALALWAQQYKKVSVHCQPGNHGRNIARHPGRATEDKWDGIEWDMYFALAQMCSHLPNVKFEMPFQAVSVIDLWGQKLGLSHGDTEVKLGNPDTQASANSAALDRINATRLYGCEFAAWAFGHFHQPRYQPRNPRVVYNGALVPPNGHARGAGYIGEPCGQFMWEAVEGYPVGDLRFIEVGPAQDHDEKLGLLIPPFRFPNP